MTSALIVKLVTCTHWRIFRVRGGPVSRVDGLNPTITLNVCQDLYNMDDVDCIALFEMYMWYVVMYLSQAGRTAGG